MIFSNSFKKTLFLSIFGHITAFGIFSFSFGNKITKTDYAQVAFWGAILYPFDLISSQNFKGSNIEIFMRRANTAPLDRVDKESPLIAPTYLKPSVTLGFNEDKMIFVQKPTPISLPGGRKESIIMFYPRLPYHFLLYFKDRQAVHIELMFNIVSYNRKDYIDIKRKISSGNLEADLLSMRYIGHYLFIQQAGFPLNKWQTVKIDLSEAKADRIE